MSVNVEWVRDEEGEYNEVVATVKDRELHVASDRDATSWHYVIDEGEMQTGFDTKQEAQEAAISEAMED